MAGLLARLFELAAKRADLKVTEVDDIDSWGFLLFRDGHYNIFINRSVRDFRKTMNPFARAGRLRYPACGFPRFRVADAP